MLLVYSLLYNTCTYVFVINVIKSTLLCVQSVDGAGGGGGGGDGGLGGGGVLRDLRLSTAFISSLRRRPVPLYSLAELGRRRGGGRVAGKNPTTSCFH